MGCKVCVWVRLPRNICHLYLRKARQGLQDIWRWDINRNCGRGLTTQLNRTSKNKAGYSNPDHIGDVFQRGLTFRSWASFPGAITIDAAVGETSEELYSLPLGGLCRAVRCCSGLSRAGLNRTNRPIVCGAGRVMSGGFAFTSDLHVWSLFYAALVVDHAPRGFSFGATNEIHLLLLPKSDRVLM